MSRGTVVFLSLSLNFNTIIKKAYCFCVITDMIWGIMFFGFGDDYVCVVYWVIIIVG